MSLTYAAIRSDLALRRGGGMLIDGEQHQSPFLLNENNKDEDRLQHQPEPL